MHASTSQILLDLLDIHLSSLSTTTTSNESTPEHAPFVTESESGALIRRLLSSFAHHVADASSYEPASVPILDTFVKEVGAAELGEVDVNRLIGMFRVMEVPILVRKGARTQGTHKYLIGTMDTGANSKVTTYYSVTPIPDTRSVIPDAAERDF